MIEVVEPGAHTTVQDRGRARWSHLGVPPAGAADPVSLTLANRLVGNQGAAAALEATLRGPTLRSARDVVVALAGAPTDASLDGTPVPMGTSVEVPAGACLQVGTVREGVRVYVAVAGGFSVPEVLGSRSTDTLAGIGPSALRAGDRLPVGGPAAAPGVGRFLRWMPPVGHDTVLRVVPGPSPFPRTANASLCRSDGWVVSTMSDRTGLRLDGDPLPTPAKQHPTIGIPTGAVQVPPDGAPILLLSNHAATGGYPILAVVATVDVPKAGQLRPGASVRFQTVDVTAARTALAELQRRLRTAVVFADLL